MTTVTALTTDVCAAVVPDEKISGAPPPRTEETSLADSPPTDTPTCPPNMPIGDWIDACLERAVDALVKRQPGRSRDSFFIGL